MENHKDFTSMSLNWFDVYVFDVWSGQWDRIYQYGKSSVFDYGIEANRKDEDLTIDVKLNMCIIGT